MDTSQDREIWGDPYIGLRWAAETPLEFARIATHTPLFLLDAGHRTLGSPGILEVIRDFLDSLLRLFDPWHIKEWLFDEGIVPIWFLIQTHVINPALTWMETWYTYFHDQVEGLRDWWSESIWPKIHDIWVSLVSIPHVIVDALTPWYTYFHAQIEGLRTWWSTSIWPRIRDIWVSLVSIPHVIVDAFTGWYTYFHDQVEGLRTWWRTSIWPAVSAFLEPFQTHSPGGWQDIINAFISPFSPGRVLGVDPMQDTIDRLRDVVSGWYEDVTAIPGRFLDHVADTAGTDLALDPSRALDIAGDLYGMAIGAGSLAHITSTTLNAIPTTNWVGASQFSAFIAEVAGFDAITKATYGTLLDGALAWPMRYHWNQKLRPKIPTEGAIYAMGRKRGLNRAEFGQAMAYHGLPESWITKEYGFFWADPSPYWLLRMSEHSTPTITTVGGKGDWLAEWLPGWQNDPMAWYRMKLMLAGFEDTDIEPFIDGFRRRRVGPALTRVKTAVRGMFREGYWTSADVAAYLLPLGVRPEELELLCRAEQLRFQKMYLDDQVRYYSESFRKGLLSRQDLSLSLSTFIANTALKAQIVAREVVRALPKPKSPVVPKEDPLIVSLRRQAVNSWAKAFRDWQITHADLVFGLTIVLQDPVLANEIAVVESRRYRVPPEVPPPPPEDPVLAKSRRDAIATWVKQFREGQVTAAVMEMGLANLIPDPALVTQIRQLEELRARPVPDILPPWEEDPALAALREEHVRGHIEMFRKRLVDVGQLFAMLLADGLAEALARATVITQALKRIKAPPLESPYFQRPQLQALMDEAIGSYTRMLQLGEITQEQYEAYLAGVGVDAAVITYLGDTQSLEAFLAASPP